MRLFELFRRPPPPSATVARERLQILFQHERAGRQAPAYLPRLQADLLRVIGKYVEIRDDKVSVNVQNGPGIFTLDINIEVPAEGAVH
jgi:cell division topological specificity factor